MNIKLLCLCIEISGIVELSLLYAESDHQLIVNLHSARDLPLELQNSSSTISYSCA